MARSWVDAEPSWGQVGREWRAVARRGLDRWYWVSLVAAALAAGLTAFKVMTPPPWQARVTFRVVEGTSDRDAAPPPPRALTEYVRDVAFSMGHLLKVMEEHGLYGALRRADPAIAVESFHEDIAVGTQYNSLMNMARSAADPARSARLTIGWQAGDPDLAVTVVRALADVVQETETTRRRELVERASRVTNRTVSALETSLVELESAASAQRKRWVEASTADAGPMWVELVRLERQARNTRLRLIQLQRRQEQLGERVRYESEAHGLRFEEVDQRVIRRGFALEGPVVGVFASVVFTMVWPVALLLFGAFDGRVRTGEDVNRLGMAMIGTVRVPRRRRKRR